MPQAEQFRSWLSVPQNGRVDEVVVFHPLSREHIRLIVDIQLGYLHDRLADRDMRIHLSDAARDRLAEAGFDTAAFVGARVLEARYGLDQGFTLTR